LRRVLRDVSFRVERGELVALMGPNGMGKTTLLAVMAGAIAPARGQVLIDGVKRRASPEEELAIRRSVFYLPAEPWLQTSYTGREWVLAVGRLYGIEDERLMDHAERLLELFELGQHADHPIRSYSSGQCKKVALCAALVTEAPVMLLDEPFAGGLDPSGILALKRILQRHAECDSATVVIATPVPELVAELADRVAVLRDGALQAIATVPGLKRLAGDAATLEEAYERLVNPKTLDRIEDYFRSMP
jgi:ABC-type multidrug transport system ATPase subunit